MAIEKKKMKKGKEKAAAPEVPVTPLTERTANAVARYLRISPRKIRLVINAIRLQPADKAFERLALIPKKGARLTEKLLRSAVANAKDRGLDLDRLYVSDTRADGGPMLKRFMPRSMGRADRILKRTTHLSIQLKEGRTRRNSGAGLQAAAKTKELKKKTAAAAGGG